MPLRDEQVGYVEDDGRLDAPANLDDLSAGADVADVAADEAGIAKSSPPDRSLWSVLNAHSTRLADFLENTPGAIDAVHSFCVSIDHYARRLGLEPKDLKVEDARVATMGAAAEFMLPLRPPVLRATIRRKR